MCGILGIQSSRLLDRKLFNKSLDLMTHRGPDSGDVYENSNSMLGHRRLKIIDLSESANQPMSSKDNLYTIVFNGEIYNYQKIAQELKKLGYKFKTNGDTEVLLNGFDAWGENLLDKINGMFAFAILNNKTGKIFIARDRLGIKPLYYYINNDTFIFASEINSIVSLLDNKLSIDYTSIVDFFTYLYVPETKTIYNNIKKLLPGNCANFHNNKFTIREYWNVNHNIDSKLSVDDSMEKLDFLINDSVKMRLVSDVPVGSFLSGGIDSSLVSYYASKNHKNIKTFYADFGNQYTNDIEIAKYLKTNHIRRSVRDSKVNAFDLMKTYGDLHYDTSTLPFYHIADVASKEVTVCLSGDGGDELFYGYNWYNSYAESSKYNFIKSIYSFIDPKQLLMNKQFQRGFKFKKYCISNDLERYVYLRGGYTKSYLNQILPESIKEKIPKDYDHYWLYRKYWDLKNVNQKSRLQYIDLKNFMVNDILLKVDMMSMLHSLEVRVPFLDHRIVELTHSLDENLINNKENKFLLKKIFQQKFPKNLLEKKKIGFGMRNLDFLNKKSLQMFNNTGSNDYKLNNMKYLVENYL
jgi:asparagine synthase (glutamine-hydrolysing)